MKNDDVSVSSLFAMLKQMVYVFIPILKTKRPHKKVV
jgi:hypothetical protein